MAYYDLRVRIKKLPDGQFKASCIQFPKFACINDDADAAISKVQHRIYAFFGTLRGLIIENPVLALPNIE